MTRHIAVALIGLLLLGLIQCFSQEEQADLRELKGTIIGVELEPSKDPANPDFWPCLLVDDQQVIMLVGESEILEELYYIIGKDVVLKAKQISNQKFGDKEYRCFEVSDIEKMDGEYYLSSQAVLTEFQQALQKGSVIIDKLMQEKIEGRLKSIWFDKNENGVIDAGDRLFMTDVTTGKNNGKNLLYPSQVIVRQFKEGEIFYDTFIFLDPFPQSFAPAVLGKLTYDAEKDSYSVEAEKIRKEGEGNFQAPALEEKTVFLDENKLLKPFVGKNVLLSGDKYDTLLWQGDNIGEIVYRGGEYIVTVKGKISVVNKPVQEPWQLTVVLLTDSKGQFYELRQRGYVGFWNDFVDKEVTVTGALRNITYISDNYNAIIEVLNIE